MASKFYVVKKGREPGIYNTWAECLVQVDKFAGAVYKSYKTIEEAREAYGGNSMRAPTRKRNAVKANVDAIAPVSDDIRLRIYCDGACSGNPGKSGSGLAIYEDGNKPVLMYGAADRVGTNNTAELNALLKALELALESEHETVQILSDSKYSIDCITNWAYGWKKAGWTKRGGEIKNLGLIKTAHALYDGIKGKVVVSHVRGHAGVEGNELADRMAVIASNKGNSVFVEYSYINVDEVIALCHG